ncbi:basic secretory protein-like protein [Pseudoalteromonas sp. MMG013]|uniref:basic secretory protein-like protein n=1 Tax=Pseudoalteromonas sp. MMG013 TaxID=2822687 RepID=UPI001FFD9431|nr:basic secretory protein-like protein [Pseudoalteromonas sp. MMG013]
MMIKLHQGYKKKYLFLAMLTCTSTGSFATTAANEDITQPNAAAITASAQNGTYESAYHAFDNDQYSKWLTFDPQGWLKYTFSKGMVIQGYSITSANDVPSRDPKSWVLQGSNDGVNWTSLNAQNGQSFSSRHQTKEYNFFNSQPFNQIRLNIQNNNGAAILQLAEVQLFGYASGDNGTNPLPVNEQHRLTTGQWQHFGPYNVANEVIATTSGTGDADLYLNVGAVATTSQHICQSTSPTANEQCSATSNDLYVSVYGYSNTQFNITIAENVPTDPGNGQWKKPVVDFVDLNPETQGSQLLKRIIQDPAAHMAQRCIDVAKVLYKDAIESNRFKKLRFELRAKDHWGKEFVAYKMGEDGSGEMTIVVSTTHLEKLYREGGNSDAAIADEIDGILFHEVTHGYNNSPLTHDSYGDGQAYWAFTEGLADGVRIGAGFHKTRQPNVNDPKKWLGGYTTTGFFFHYVQSRLDNQFIYKFNKAAKDMGNYTWSFDAAFRQTLGRGVEDVWNEYVTFINNGGQLEY